VCTCSQDGGKITEELCDEAVQRYMLVILSLVCHVSILEAETHEGAASMLSGVGQELSHRVAWC
jgi:hypothetical protein